MRIVDSYSFNNGREIIERNFPQQFREIIQVVESVNAQECKNKTSAEQTNAGTLLFAPRDLNAQFEHFFF